MPCVKCNGYWQCSRTGPTCDSFAAPVDTQVHAFVIQTKKAGNKCMMQVKHLADRSEPEEDQGDWQDAGAIPFRFTLYEAQDGGCVVNVEPVDPE